MIVQRCLSGQRGLILKGLAGRFYAGESFDACAGSRAVMMIRICIAY
jgi:hypothetical protein